MGCEWELASISDLVSRVNQTGLVIVLQVFYDASSKINVATDRFITLAGIGATIPTWKAFEQAWANILHEHKAPISTRSTSAGVRYFHCREALYARGGYKHWKKEPVFALASDLSKTIRNVQYSDKDFSEKLLCLVCTMDRVAYENALRVKPNLYQIEKILLDFSCGQATRHIESKNGIDFLFDCGDKKSEPYLEMINDYFIQGRQRKSWMKLLRTRSQVEDMRNFPALQAADLLAWSGNRFCGKGLKDRFGQIHANVLFSARSFHAFFDEKAFDLAFGPKGHYRRKQPCIPLLPTGTNALVAAVAGVL